MASDLFRRRVYILASRSRVLYTGSTADLHRRIFQHKEALTAGFTSRYGVDRLMYFESYCSILGALARERETKSWRRAKRVDLIEQTNAGWLDLDADWFPEANRPGPSLRSG